jgi:hypothetical protein
VFGWARDIPSFNVRFGRIELPAGICAGSEHDPEKRVPVFPATDAMRLRGDHAQTRDGLKG